MLELWIATIGLIAFFIFVAWLWMRVWIIGIFKSINESRKSKYTMKQWIVIWLFALLILITVVFILIKWNINLL